MPKLELRKLSAMNQSQTGSDLQFRLPKSQGVRGNFNCSLDDEMELEVLLPVSDVHGAEVGGSALMVEGDKNAEEYFVFSTFPFSSIWVICPRSYKSIKQCFPRKVRHP